MQIISYLDVKNRALQLLKQINSKGYVLSKKQSYHSMFVLYLKSNSACRNDTSFDDHETLIIYKNIQIIRVDLYCDGNYPRGISITYLLDGWKSQCMNYVYIMDERDELTKYTLNLKKNQYIKKIRGIKGRVLQTLTLIASDGTSITAGTSRNGVPFESEVPTGCLPFTLGGCFYTGFPFPSLINIVLKVKRQETGQIFSLQPNILKKCHDEHNHFDPVGKLQSDFVRLKKIEILTLKVQSKEQNEAKQGQLQLRGQRKVEEPIFIDVIKGVNLTYSKRFTDGKKISPFEQSKNPTWKRKEWVEDVTEIHQFLEAPADKELNPHVLDLSNPDEFITRVQGIGNTYISKIEFTTNFGRKVEVGHEFPDFFKDMQLVTIPQNMVPQKKHFELDMPKGSKVVCISGAYNENLISLLAHYE